MNSYIITDADGNWVNTIVSTLEFAQEAYPNCTYTIEVEPEVPTEFAQQIEEQEARMWRDSELSSSDFIVPLSDHPQRDAYITYREELRQWPSTDAFPATRPELGE